jgi:hypothetical protein
MAKIQGRRLLILVGALALTLGAVAWTNQRDNVDDPPGGAVSISEKAATEHTHIGQIPAIQIRSEDQPVLLIPSSKIRYGDVEQDIFSPHSWRPPVLKLPSQTVSLPPAAPPLPFTYIGKIVNGDKLTIVVSSPDGNYAITSGKVIDGKYRVENVDDFQVVFTYLPLNIQQPLLIGASK